MQGRNEGQQRRLKQWLLGMLVCWWERLEERHDENAGTIDEGAFRAARDSPLLLWTSLLPPGKKRKMTVEEKIRKQACIDAYRQDMGGAEEQARNEGMTVQYLECEHGLYNT